ncbi:MAG TPA: hypothetical protein VGH97_11950 [Thermoanaerobaculia bacterium]
MHPSPQARRVSRAAALAWACLALSCSRPPEHVAVKNPEYLVVRPIVRTADAEHTIPVDLPYAGAGYGFASTAALLDLTAFEPGAAAFAGGRTSVVGEATIWLPLTPEGSRRLDAWSSHAGGQYLGIFLRGKLIAAPQVKSRISGGIPLRVPNKGEGDRVLRELRAGGVIE